MKSFIEDAKETNGLTAVQRDWVASVMEMCHPVEDIIEEFMYHLSKRRKHANFLKRIFQLPKDLWVRRKAANDIQEINKKIKSIPERGQRYGVTQIEGKSSRDDQNTDQRRVKKQNEAMVYAKSDRLVGIDDDGRNLEEWLTTGERELIIISIVGMGGSGKTSLAAKAYNSPTVKRSFDCYAWITVSQTYEIDDLLRIMIKEFYSSQKMGVPMDLRSLEYKDLLGMLVEYLKLKRYIVVLDDVWDMKLWKDMKISFPEEGRGSRVILTTRNENIAAATYGVRSHIHRIKPLKHKEAWELFCTTAFISNANRACPQELEEIAYELLQKCVGLPLAILALGGALSSKKLLSEWIQFGSSLNHELSNNDTFDEVKKRILLFSFKDLSYQLKRCFLYCCLFPEDYPMKRKRLIRLWMAEGFVNKSRSKTQELMANDYLLELVHRNMLQVVNRNEFGRPIHCKMHDMMRELALSMSENENFCSVYDGEEGNQERRTRIRRLSIHKKLDNATRSLNGSTSLLRSLLVFATDIMRPSSAVNLPSGFLLLRVLDLENLPIEKLPDEVAYLFNLRYMNLRNTKVKELPKLIGNLRNLQTLNTKDSHIEEFPAELVKLENLQYLIMYRYKNYHHSRSEYCYVFGTPVPSNIYKLKNLQVLACVEAEPNLMRQLKNMTQLTRIDITKLRKEDEKDLCTAIGNMHLLRNMFVMVIDENEDLRVNAIPSAPPCLKDLSLAGKLVKVPSWFPSLQSLTSLALHWSRLDEDPLPHIQQLPNLGKLFLVNAYTGDQLSFSRGFKKLAKLFIINFTQLKKITINEGVMPGLKLMTLRYCMELKMVPHGIEHLTQLEELRLQRISSELLQRITGEKSTDRPSVRHIPVIDHYYESEHGWTYESLSRFDIYEGLDD